MNNKLLIFLVIVIFSLGLGYTLGHFLIPGLFSPEPSLAKLFQLGGNREDPEANVPVNRSGKIFLSLDKSEAKVGETVKAEIMINTGDKTISGVDVVIKFDPASLTMLTSQVTASESAEFTTFPVNKVDSTAGEIKFSALTAPDGGFSGETSIGSFLLQPAKTGKLDLRIVFNGAGDTKDANLAERVSGEDILGEVKQTSLNIQE